MTKDTPGISKLLKTINSPQRREILRVISSYSRTLSFSNIMEEFRDISTSSSQMAYHLSLLVETGLIEKDKEGKYGMTKLGNRTGLLLEMSHEDENTAIFSSLYFSFSSLNPIDCLIGSLSLIALLLIGLSFENGIILLTLVTFVIYSLIITYMYSKLKSIKALLFFTSLLWVFFVRGSIYLFLFIVLQIMTIIPLFDSQFTILPEPINILISTISFVTSIAVAIIYYQKYHKPIL